MFRVFLRFILGKQKRDEISERIWERLPFIHLIGMTTLPDGNKIFYLMRYRRSIQNVIDEVYHIESYERKFEIDRGFKVVDIGANIGVFTLKSSRLVGETGLILSIEPESMNYRLLVSNIKINNCINAIPLRLAASNFNGKAQLNIIDTIRHSLVRESQESVEVTATKLDDILVKTKMRKADLLKLDIEGAELEALQGAEKTLQTPRIKVVVAAYHTETEADEIYNYLYPKGFKISLIKIAWDARLKREPEIFLHAEKKSQ